MKKTIRLFAGGNAGIETMMESCSATSFRRGGGGIFINDFAWQEKFTKHERIMVAYNNRGASYAIELDHSIAMEKKPLAEHYRELYAHNGIIPDVILIRISFEKESFGNLDWVQLKEDFKKTGFPGLLLPVFDYQNNPNNAKKLMKNRVSLNHDFQNLIRLAGGIAIDCPAGLFLTHRESDYKLWVLDSIKWTRATGGKSLILSTDSKEYSQVDIENQIKFFIHTQLIPDFFVIGNSDDNGKIVGREWIADTVFGIAYNLAFKFLPSLGIKII